ncbi:MAG: class I SAM-dependent methyltransferase [Solirubrobacteraceae bacterium]
MSTGHVDRRSGAFKAASVPANYERHLAPIIFEDWAQRLVETVGVKPGDSILDVASGTGVVAREAARQAGRDGRVVAADVSEAMLAQAASHAARDDSAAIEFVAASASQLPLQSGSFDAVVCQQGLQFFSDKPAALAEMRRVLRPTGAVGLAVWAAGHRLQPFDDYAEALASAGVPPPFPRAFENDSFTMASDTLADLLDGAGFAAPEIAIVEQQVVWPDAEAAAAGILGTPFGPLVSELPDVERAALFIDLGQRFAPAAGTGAVERTTVSVIARAVASAG